MKSVLITGAAGFVGRHFQEALEDEYNLSCIDVLADPSVDCRDFFRKDDHRFDLVVHLAAIVGGRLTIENEPLRVATDLSVDAELFQWAMRTRPGRIIYYSSSAAYPTHLQTQPYRLKEADLSLDLIGQPDMTYGWAKLTGEVLAQHAQAEGLRVHVFRPFSGYGEDQALDYPFPSFMRRVHLKHSPFEIWGDGTQVRDFIHISDVVNATLEAVRQDVPGPVNLGSGVPVSFLELARMAFGVANWSAPIEVHPERPSGVAYRCADVTKMSGFYLPKISLEEGIRRALRSL